MAKRNLQVNTPLSPIKGILLLLMVMILIWASCGTFAYFTIPPADPYKPFISSYIYFPATVTIVISGIILFGIIVTSLISVLSPKNNTALPPKVFSRFVKPYFTDRIRPAFELQESTSPVQDQLRTSKLGGIPYWPEHRVYPQNKQHQDLRLLAQINFAELPSHDLFPSSGILQFFITQQHMYGYSELPENNGYAVIYHEDSDSPQTPRDIPQLTLDDDTSPLIKNCRISFTQTTEAPPTYTESTPEIINDYFTEKDFDDPDEEMRAKGIPIAKPVSKLFGYATPIQTTLRGIPKQSEAELILLLQLLSEDDLAACIWGDMGGGYFLISSEDLKHRHFHKAVFTWDCY